MNEPFPFIYTVLSVLAILCLILRRSKIGIAGAIILSVMMAFVAFFRGDYVGSDYENYIYIYNHANNLKATDITGDTIDIGFAALILFFKAFGFGHVVFYGFCYLVFWGGVIKYCRFIKADLIYSIFFFYFLGYYFNSFNILRQMMAIGIVLFIIPQLYKRKYFIFIMLLILIALVHKSVLLCLLLVPIYIISQKKEINKTFLTIILICSYAIYYIGMTYFYQYLTLLMHVLNVTDSFGQYVENGELRQEIGNLTSTAYTLFAFLLIFCKNKKTYRFETNTVVLSYALFNVGNLLMVQGIRIFMWFNIFAVPLLPLMILEKNTKYRTLFQIASLVMVLSLFVIQYVIGNNNEVKPYYMIWGKI